MSLKPIPAHDLTQIASNISIAKTNALVSRYYNEIIVAAHEGKFTVTFHMSKDDFGQVCLEEWEAMEAVEKFFEGIHVSYDYRESTYTFEWFKTF